MPVRLCPCVLWVHPKAEVYKTRLDSIPDPKHPSLKCSEAIPKVFHQRRTACLPERKQECGDGEGGRLIMSFTNADGYSSFFI
jgi:hypothetical protein